MHLDYCTYQTMKNKYIDYWILILPILILNLKFIRIGMMGKMRHPLAYQTMKNKYNAPQGLDTFSMPIPIACIFDAALWAINRVALTGLRDVFTTNSFYVLLHSE